MIPSQNDQKLTKESWHKASKSFLIADFPDWTCDACMKHFHASAGGVQEPWEFADNGSVAPRIQEIGGVKYFSCSQDCARILFMIHQQYALREQGQRDRFFTTLFSSGSLGRFIWPVVIDLDAVTSIHTNLEEIKNDSSWVDFYVCGYGIEPNFGGLLARKEAQRIMDLWKKKPWKGSVS